MKIGQEANITKPFSLILAPLHLFTPSHARKSTLAERKDDARVGKSRDDKCGCAATSSTGPRFSA